MEDIKDDDTIRGNIMKENSNRKEERREKKETIE